MSFSPLFVYGTLFLLGTSFAFWFPNFLAFSIFLCLCGIIFYCVVRFTKIFGKYTSLFLLISLGTLSFSLGAVRTYISFPQEPPFGEYLSQEVSLSGYIAEEPIQKETYIRYSVVAYNLKNVRVLVYDDLTSQVSYGDSVTLEGKLSRPENKDTFDWVGYLSHQNIFYEIKYPHVIIENSERVPFFVGLQKKLFSIKYAFSENLSRVIPEPAASLAGGELLGEKRLLDKKLNDALKISGVSHIVVLSGYNVTIVSETIMRVLSFLPKNISLYGALFGIFLFAGTAGFSASVMRAALMATLLLLARRAGAHYQARRALFIAAILLVLIKPTLLLYDASFQLSFLATMGILYGQKYFEKKFIRITPRFGLRPALATTVSAQLAVLPLLINLSGGIQILSIPANMLILPTVPPVMFLSLATGVLGFFSYSLSYIFGIASTVLISYQLVVINFIGSISFANILVPYITSLFAVLFYVVFFVKILWKEEEK